MCLTTSKLQVTVGQWSEIHWMVLSKCVSKCVKVRPQNLRIFAAPEHYMHYPDSNESEISHSWKEWVVARISLIFGHIAGVMACLVRECISLAHTRRLGRQEVGHNFRLVLWRHKGAIMPCVSLLMSVWYINVLCVVSKHLVKDGRCAVVQSFSRSWAHTEGRHASYEEAVTEVLNERKKAVKDMFN